MPLCANSVPNKNGGMAMADAVIKTLDEARYTVIPPSGTFRDLIGELDFIIGHLGCRILQLLPIHPTPTTYARMGRFGSPYAALSFTAVDPALAEFDPKATPMEQFIELIDAVHARGARLFIDIAINHTGWAASLHETNPQWLAREPDGQIETPGAWGVVWADLTRLDYHHQDLWQYMADVFLTWCRRGVDGFRCDAGYMIPTPAWRYIIAKVREQFPDVIFLLEGLGGKISVTRELLGWADFNWAYSELFQNYDRGRSSTTCPNPWRYPGPRGPPSILPRPTTTSAWPPPPRRMRVCARRCVLCFPARAGLHLPTAWSGWPPRKSTFTAPRRSTGARRTTWWIISGALMPCWLPIRRFFILPGWR